MAKEIKSYEEENFSSCIRINIVFWNDWFSMTNNGYANFKNADNKYIDMELVYQNNSVYVLYDKNTKVMYLCVEGYNMMGITPIYNSDGTVKLYDGE